MAADEKITVTSPLLPDMDEFYGLLKQIWDKRWITNNGDFHKKLESALCDYLKVPYLQRNIAAHYCIAGIADNWGGYNHSLIVLWQLPMLCGGTESNLYL